jgi:hypothetical protein
MGVMTKGEVFGATICHMYTIEWQKRGLLHAHILFWLQQKLCPTHIDHLIFAEFLDPSIDPHVYDVIKSSMVHGPCGAVNPQSKCMEHGKYSKRYPRDLLAETQTGDDGYPLHRQRNPEGGGFTATIKLHNGAKVVVNNSWVVPHCPLLSKMFTAHINLEFCNSIKAIKYIYKYINKGSDRTVFEV